ncbi:MAG: hypothetical protein JWP33_1168 [Blastococcus sp.]|jgi:hypothetical protein|nr:hypothetical protein [Blastococcus sp.]
MDPRPGTGAPGRWSGAALLVVMLLSTAVALALSSPHGGMVLIALTLVALPVLVVVAIWLMSRRHHEPAQPQ